MVVQVAQLGQPVLSVPVHGPEPVHHELATILADPYLPEQYRSG
jgi:hypothetical protein